MSIRWRLALQNKKFYYRSVFKCLIFRQYVYNGWIESFGTKKKVEFLDHVQFLFSKIFITTTMTHGSQNCRFTKWKKALYLQFFVVFFLYLPSLSGRYLDQFFSIMI